jgi:hypothetical protein
MECESEFQRADRYAGINITATGSNVITLGDGNVVNANYADLLQGTEYAQGSCCQFNSSHRGRKA